MVNFRKRRNTWRICRARWRRTGRRRPRRGGETRRTARTPTPSRGATRSGCSRSETGNCSNSSEHVEFLSTLQGERRVGNKAPNLSIQLSLLNICSFWFGIILLYQNSHLLAGPTTYRRSTCERSRRSVIRWRGHDSPSPTSARSERRMRFEHIHSAIIELSLSTQLMIC